VDLRWGLFEKEKKRIGVKEGTVAGGTRGDRGEGGVQQKGKGENRGKRETWGKKKRGDPPLKDGRKGVKTKWNKAWGGRKTKKPGDRRDRQGDRKNVLKGKPEVRRV